MPTYPPFASSDAIRRKMSGQRQRDTTPELALRKALYGAGLRYRIHRAPINGLRRSADLVFAATRVAVFVDGCFWHGCPVHGRRRHETNAWYWPEKINRNQRRDQDTNERFTAAGWLAIRVWEHEDTAVAAERVRAAIETRKKAMTRRSDARASGVQKPVSTS